MSEFVGAPRSDSRTLRERVTVVGVVGVAVTTVAFVAVGGIIGFVVGSLVGLLGLLLLPPTFAFAAGHVVYLLVGPEEPTLWQVVLLESGLTPLLVAPVARTAGGWRVAVAVGLCFAGFAALVSGGVQTFEKLWAPVALFVVTVGVLVYGIHRYELVALGLVEEEP